MTYWPYHENCFIAPSSRDAAIVAKWCKGGTARGFFVDGILVIFDGYGNTHTSMSKVLTKRGDAVSHCFIIAEDGNLRIEDICKSYNFLWLTEQVCKEDKETYNLLNFFAALAKALGNPFPKLQPMD